MNRKYFITREKLEEYLKTLSIDQISELEGISKWTIMKRIKEYELKPLGASYFNRGCNNPAKREEVRQTISKTVKGLWDNGIYADRINGMAFKFDWEHPNYNPARSYRDYAKMYHNPITCYYCGCSEEERKIDIHHLDENRENWLLSNLLPVCNVCHTFFHYRRYKSPFVKISKQFTFESAHHLLNYSGPCECNHGHSYSLDVVLYGPVNRDTGMVIDYKQLKGTVQKYIIDVLDHATINDKMDCNPTAENMLFFIWEKLEKEGLVKGLYEISLKETATSTATIDKYDMMNYYITNKELICHSEIDRIPFPKDARKTVCEICGKEFWKLSSHISKAHEIDLEEYKELFPHALVEDPLITKWATKNIMRKVKQYTYKNSR